MFAKEEGQFRDLVKAVEQLIISQRFAATLSSNRTYRVKTYSEATTSSKLDLTCEIQTAADLAEMFKPLMSSETK